MLEERVLAEAERYRLRQYCLRYKFTDIETGSSAISVGPKNTANIKNVVVYLPGYPGDSIETGHALGRELTEMQERDDTITLVAAYRGVISQEMLLAGTGFSAEELASPLELSKEEFSFRNAINSADDLVTSARDYFKGARITVIGSSYFGLFAIEYFEARDIARVILLNPVVDMEKFLIEYDVSKLLKEGIESRKIKADSRVLYSEHKQLLNRFNPIEKKVIETSMPVTIYRGECDEELPRYHAEQLAKRLVEIADDFRFVRILRGDHNFNQGREELFSYIMAEILNNSQLLR